MGQYVFGLSISICSHLPFGSLLSCSFGLLSLSFQPTNASLPLSFSVFWPWLSIIDVCFVWVIDSISVRLYELFGFSHRFFGCGFQRKDQWVLVCDFSVKQVGFQWGFPWIFVCDFPVKHVRFQLSFTLGKWYLSKL